MLRRHRNVPEDRPLYLGSRIITREANCSRNRLLTTQYPLLHTSTNNFLGYDVFRCLAVYSLHWVHGRLLYSTKVQLWSTTLMVCASKAGLFLFIYEAALLYFPFTAQFYSSSFQTSLAKASPRLEVTSSSSTL